MISNSVAQTGGYPENVLGGFGFVGGFALNLVLLGYFGRPECC